MKVYSVMLSHIVKSCRIQKFVNHSHTTNSTPFPNLLFIIYISFVCSKVQLACHSEKEHGMSAVEESQKKRIERNFLPFFNAKNFNFYKIL